MEENLGPWWPVSLLAAAATASAVPIIVFIDLLNASGRGEAIGGSRLKTAGNLTDEVKEILRKMDPIDSLYFDVSVSRHMLEEGDAAKALEWLDPNHALGELRNSMVANFLTEDEFDEVGETIIKIQAAVNAGNLAGAHAIIVPLQDSLAEKAYTTFKELDPVPDGWLNSRYEATREQKIAEWRAKGYNEDLIAKTLKWADEWSKGMATRFIKDPVMRVKVEESLYPEALELSEKFIEAMSK